MKKYEKQYGTNINADKLSKMIKKATIELKENNEQVVAIKKEISTGLGKRRLMLSEMSGFDLSGNVQNLFCLEAFYFMCDAATAPRRVDRFA